MTDEELNRDIAEWCGFERKSSFGHTYWVKPSGRIIKHLPNFLDEIQGLGLLFKYAVPRLYYVELKMSGKMQYQSVQVQLTRNSESYYEQDKSPTRALAMAIWKIKEATDATE